MKATRIFGVLATVAVALALLPFTAQTAFAEDVSSVTGQTDGEWRDAAVLDGPADQQLSIELNTSFELQSDDSGWHKKNGENWEHAAAKFGTGTYRYQAVIRITATTDAFASNPTFTVNGEEWTFIKQEQVDVGGTSHWQGTFASPEVTVMQKLDSPAPLIQPDDKYDPYISWKAVDGAQKYEITVRNETDGFNQRSTTVTVNTGDPSLVVKDGRATYNIGSALGKVTCKDGANWFVITVKAIAEGYEDSEVASSPSGTSHWLFYVLKTLNGVGIDEDTSVFTWDPHPYEETRYYYYWLTIGTRDGKQFVDGYFNTSKTSLNMDAYIEQFNHAQPGKYWVHVYATTWDKKQLTQVSERDYTYAPKIRTLSFNGIAQPMEGDRAKAPLNDYSLNEDYASTMKLNEGSAYWRHWNGSAWEVMTDTETFEASGKYLISIPIKYDEGYKLISNPTVTVNGMPVTATVDVLSPTTARVDCEMDVIAKSDSVYVVTAGALNVRANASATAERIGGLKYGDVVEATGQLGAWTMTNFEGQTAWVNTNYLALAREDAVFEDGPVNYTLYAGAIRVRDEPSTTATSPTEMTSGKTVLATGAVENAEGTWIVIDYTLAGERKLGYMRFSYVGSSGNMVYLFTSDSTPPVKEVAEEDSPTDELVISTGTYPKVTFAPYSKSAIATGDASGLNAQLGDDNYINKDDGYLFATIFPEDAINFDSLTIDKITLPAVFTERGMRVLELAKNDDGSITLKLGAVAYEFSVGADGSWTKGSPEGFGFKVNRNVDDDLTFGLFVGLAVDGVAVDASNYAASAGSLDVVLSASYLEGLSAGTHDVAVSFEDGAAETTLTINEKASSGGGSGGTDDADDGKDNATTQDGKDAQDTQDGGLLDAAQRHKPAVGVSSSAEGQTPRGGVPATGDAMRPGVLAAVAVAALGLAALAASKLRRPCKRPAHAKR